MTPSEGRATREGASPAKVSARAWPRGTTTPSGRELLDRVATTSNGGCQAGTRPAHSPAIAVAYPASRPAKTTPARPTSRHDTVPMNAYRCDDMVVGTSWTKAMTPSDVRVP